MRLDHHLTQINAFESRARAQEAIKAGHVTVNGSVATKPAQKISEGDEVRVEGHVHDYVSRGGVKLAAALTAFNIDAQEKICLDLGASTGGFSDVLLRAGAAKIYAVDVGQGQLHPRIDGDPRVINLEQTHAKDLTCTLVPDPIEVLVCDVSFISLKKALPGALALTAPGAKLAALIKPQFEVGRAQLGKGGIVKPGHKNTYGVAEDIAQWLGAQAGWTPIGYMASPIAGGDGNFEFLIGAHRAA